MTVNLYRIDAIADYDQAIEALADYVAELVEEFVDSQEGKAYLKAYPEMAEYVGSWVDNLLYFGYAYESVTLPQMSRSNVETIVTRIFPNKVSLNDPEEAETTIPELLAFWQFLKREYQQPQASSIIKFLQNIQPKFKTMMNDPNNFGIAKSFFMAGSQAGFDMTSEEGLQAFQAQYNQNLNLTAASSNVPEELQFLLNSIQEKIGQINLRPQEVESEAEENYEKQLITGMWQDMAEKLPPLSTKTRSLLENVCK